MAILANSTAGHAWPGTAMVQAQFLATSTLIRGTWGWNQDAYLAELELASGGQFLLVRLIDEYLNWVQPLSRAVLSSLSGTTLNVRRNMECDIPYEQMLLHTAPWGSYGDLIRAVKLPTAIRPDADIENGLVMLPGVATYEDF